MGGVSLSFLKSLVQRSPSSHAYEKLPIGKDKPVETPQSSQPPIKESKDEVSFSSHRQDQTPTKQSMTPLQKLSNGFKSRFQALKNEFSPPPPERIHKETLNADGSKTTDYWNGKDYTKSITTHADGSKTSSFNEEKKFRESKITTPKGTVQSQYGNYRSFKVLDGPPPATPKSFAQRLKDRIFPPPKPELYPRDTRIKQKVHNLKQFDEQGNRINYKGARDYTEFKIGYKDGQQYIISQKPVKKEEIVSVGHDRMSDNLVAKRADGSLEDYPTWNHSDSDMNEINEFRASQRANS